MKLYEVHTLDVTPGRRPSEPSSAVVFDYSEDHEKGQQIRIIISDTRFNKIHFQGDVKTIRRVNKVVAIGEIVNIRLVYGYRLYSYETEKHIKQRIENTDNKLERTKEKLKPNTKTSVRKRNLKKQKKYQRLLDELRRDLDEVNDEINERYFCSNTV